MIQKTFSEGICVETEGPMTSRAFESCYTSNAEKSYISAVSLVPKLVPKRTFFTLDGVLPKATTIFNRSCSLSNGEKLYGSSVSLDQDSLTNGEENGLNYECDFPYYQNIELEPQLVVKDFSETIHNFPREQLTSCKSSLMYDPCHIKENYIVGLKVNKVKEIVLPNTDEMTFFTATKSIHVLEEGEIQKKLEGHEHEYNGISNIINSH